MSNRDWQVVLSPSRNTHTHGQSRNETEMLFLCMKFDSLGEKHAHKWVKRLPGEAEGGRNSVAVRWSKWGLDFTSMRWILYRMVSKNSVFVQAVCRWCPGIVSVVVVLPMSVQAPTLSRFSSIATGRVYIVLTSKTQLAAGKLSRGKHRFCGICSLDGQQWRARPTHNRGFRARRATQKKIK